MNPGHPEEENSGSIKTKLSRIPLLRQIRKKCKTSRPLKLQCELPVLFKLKGHGYRSPKKIAEGGCAFVYTVQKTHPFRPFGTRIEDPDTRSDTFAAKVSKRPISHQCPQERLSWWRECDILSSLNHKNLVKCLEFFHLGGHQIMILDYVDGSDLFDKISESDSINVNARSISCQILEGVHYLHTEKYIAHMDLKVENILVNKEGIVKICDFGSAVRIPEDCKIRTNGIVTPSSLPPEYFHDDFVDPRPCDMWGVGVIIHLLLLQRYPYGDDFAVTRDISIFKQPLDFKDVDWGMFRTLIDLIQRCLQLNPRKRITARNALQSPFFKL